MAELELELDLNLDIDFDEGVEVANPMDSFYEKEFFFSYSSMKLLLFNPPSFKEKYIDKNYEEKLDKHLINGKLIHALILEPDKIDEKFIVLTTATPTGKTRNILHNVVKKHAEMGSPAGTPLQHYSRDILQQLAELNLHQALVDDKKDSTLTGDKKRLDKIFTPENTEYFRYMCERRGKDVVDQAQMDYCVNAASVIKTNEEIVELMGINKTEKDHNTVLNERLYSLPLQKYKFGLKGIIDNINVDHTKKIIFVNDLKTTSGDLASFPETLQFFDYAIQAIIYIQLVARVFDELMQKRGYKVEFRFVVIDKFLHVYPFQVKESTLNTWLLEFNKKLEAADFHYTNKSFDLPYSFATKQVML